MPNCIVCSQELIGRKTLYCSPHCRRKNYYLKNKKSAKEGLQEILKLGEIDLEVLPEESVFLSNGVIIDANIKNLPLDTLHINKKGYALFSISHGFVPLHRVVVCLHGYTLEEGQVVDHINRNKLDCRIANLRITNFSGNASNKEKTKNKKNSNYKGVHKTKSGKWQTQVWVGGKNLCFGSFETQEEAARKYNEKAIEFFGEFACLNLVE